MPTQLYHENQGLVERGAKRCPRCRKIKPLDCFHRKRGKEGGQGWCKTCVRVDMACRHATP
ncbi:MAG: hypothetical protein P4L84_11305 [Isosphaeraceae bacterium]|nr:hypothetical protein [Isosphaeraceae bacterium]